MLTSRRDYLLRIIDEVGRMLARVIFQREKGRQQDALQSVVQACERLFGLEADKLFQFSPDQHFAMLAEGETPEAARDKILLYAALNTEAGRVYRELANPTMANVSLLNALRFTLKAEKAFPREGWPAFAPSVEELGKLLQGIPLDPETTELMRERS